MKLSLSTLIHIIIFFGNFIDHVENQDKANNNKTG
jgi:hypothetical protein